MDTTGSKMNSAEELKHGIEAMYQTRMVADGMQLVTHQILDLATHLTGAGNCSLMMLNGQGELYVMNACGLAEATMKASRVKVGEGVSGQVIVEGNPLLVEDISSDSRFAIYRRDRYKTGSFIACPITVKENVIGVLNLAEKNNGEPFNLDDLDQAKLVSGVAETALRSFLGDRHLKFDHGDLGDVLHGLIEAEHNNREFVARITHDLRIPLNNIKGAAYSLKNLPSTDSSESQEYVQIIEKEVNYLISYIDKGARNYEKMQLWLEDLEEREKYKKLLE